jgi:hypothetical protein
MRIEVTVRDIPIDVARYVRDPESIVYRNITQVRSDEDIARRVVLDEMTRVANAAKRARKVAAVLGIDSDLAEIIRLAGIVQRRNDINDQPEGTA